jgi:hypothetical protein
MEWIGWFRCEKFEHIFVYRTCELMALIRPVSHQLSCINKMVRNDPKHEFCVQWSGLGAFVAKNSDATSSRELVRQWHPFGQFCTDFHKVTKRCETTQNISFRSNGVNRVCSLRKILTQLHLANLCVNGTSSVHFASTFVLPRNSSKRPKHEFWVQWSGSGASVAKNSDATSSSKPVR